MLTGRTMALRHPAHLASDAAAFLLLLAPLGLIALSGRQAAAPFQPHTPIDLSLSALPRDALLSLGRAFMAYLLSLGFALVYGSVAAHHRRAERILIPALDVLQAIPVLGFLPGLVLAMIALFPTREIGLEAACVLMIFTSQVWNMAFSYHSSVRGIPPALREVAALQKLSGWQAFRLLELPAATIGLVWNSMLSMAGGWFFLTVSEAFTLGNQDFRLPGIGSYMNEAVHQGNVPAMIGAVAVMTLLIVVVDQLLWRPLVVWSERFKLEDTASAAPGRSRILDIVRGASFLHWRGRLRRAGHRATAPRAAQRTDVPGTGSGASHSGTWHGTTSAHRSAALPRSVLRALGLGGVVVLTAGGTWTLARMLVQLPLHDGGTGKDWAHVGLALLASAGRTSLAVILGAAWTLPVGILIGRSRRWSHRLQPVIQTLAGFPAPMLFPLLALALARLHVPFGLGCVTLMLAGAQWYILFNVIAGAQAIPEDLLEVARVCRLPRSEIWRRLYLPGAFPYLVTGLVTAAGGAWNATIVSELVQTRGRTFDAFGLGAIISHATADGNYPLLAASVVTMTLFVVLLNRVLWKRLFAAAEGRYSLAV